MYIKRTYLTVLALISLASATYAMPPQPAKCPSVDSLKSSGLSYSSLGSKGYTVAQFSNYGTNNKWLFGFTSIQATSAQNAMSIGYQLLDTLFGAPQPVPIESQNVWGCLYQTSQGAYGVALTPVNTTAAINPSLLASIR